ncbi:NAC domain-containing protein JA2-like [Syzygium oleosum]|uniref:NAC domain-containing protein JA2-like n=1 Tax=Syzygium oleosum TaxID=219896 RepID=UPI0024BA8323|nr:NAC domain-containing protein JA2-like [Syzygium oleosum]
MADTLPIGYRFSPSDEQLFFYYLAHRVRGDLSFSGFIPKFDVYEKEPWKFFDENADRSLYVFTKIKMKKSRAERTAGSGFWKGVKTTDIEDHQGNIVGHKKHFNFKVKDGSSFERENAAKGSWIMHEYSMLKQEVSRILLLYHLLFIAM